MCGPQMTETVDGFSNFARFIVYKLLPFVETSFTDGFANE